MRCCDASTHAAESNQRFLVNTSVHTIQLPVVISWDAVTFVDLNEHSKQTI